MYDGGVKLHLAAEHMLDGLFLKRIDVGEVMAFDTARGADETLSDASLRNADATKRGGATTKRHEGAYDTLRYDNENEKVDVGVDVDKGGKLLVETSYYTPPMNMGRMMEGIIKRGYEPILAHPERYQYMETKDYKRWKNMGVMLQLNVPSVVGAYGPEVQRKAEWLLKENMYDFCGTDTHSVEQVGLLLNSLISKKTVKRIQAIPNEL